jgi:hypothetical protein
MAKKRDPYLADAQAQSIVRYGPEISALKALQLAAQQSYEDRLRAAKTARQFTVGAVDQALPQVAAAYQGAQQATTPAFAQQGGLEAGALTARMGEAQALAQQQLAARRVSAVEGQGAARDQALRDFRLDRQKIGDRVTDLSREMGAFTTSTATDAKGAAAAQQTELDKINAQLGQSERNSIRSSGFDPDTGLPLPGGKADPRNRGKSSRDWVTHQQQQETGAEIQRLIKEAAESHAAGEKRHEVADYLVNGAPAGKQPVYEVVPDPKAPGGKRRQKKLVRDANGNLVEATVDDPGFEKAKSQLLASVALDIAYDGHISRRNQKLLHDNGIQIGPLGLPTYGEWERRRRRTANQNRNPHATGGRPEHVPGYHGSI